MDSYEVYFGTGGVWQRIELPGSAPVVRQISGSDFFRPSLLETVLSVSSVVLISATENISVRLAEGLGTVVASGVFVKTASDTANIYVTDTMALRAIRSTTDSLVPVITDVNDSLSKFTNFVTKSATESLGTRIVDNSSLLSISGTRNYGQGLYGAGNYGP